MSDEIDSLKKEIKALSKAYEELKNKFIYQDKYFKDTMFNLTNDNFSTVSLSADKYIRVGREGYRAGVEGANALDQIVFWAGANKPYDSAGVMTAGLPYYVLADGTLHATKAFIGTGGTDADDLATLDEALGLATDAYGNALSDAEDYTEDYLVDGTRTTTGMTLKTSNDNLLINYGSYWLYAANADGQGFYVNKTGDAVFTGNITASEITGSKFYGSGVDPAYIEVGSIGSNADLSVYKGTGTYPSFRVYDEATFISLQSGTNSAVVPSAFLNLYSTEARPQDIWDFSDAVILSSGQVDFSDCSTFDLPSWYTVKAHYS